MPTCEDLVGRIEREAIETLSKANSLIVDQQPEPDISGKPIGDTTSDPRSEHGKVKSNVNNPEAQVWGIGKSKL